MAKAAPANGHVRLTFESGEARIELMVPIHQALHLMRDINAASGAALLPAQSADLHPFPTSD